MKTNLFKEQDACFVTSKTNRLYLCNYATSNGILILTKKNSYLLTDFRYLEEAKQILGPKGYTILDYKPEELQSILKDIFALENIQTVGVEEEILYPAYQTIIKALEGYDIKHISKTIGEMRAVKTDEEKKIIRYAQNINEKAFDKVKSIIKHGITERDLSIELKYQLLKNGADEFAFEPIVAFGKNTSKPHCLLSDKKLENGDIIMLDFGAKYKNYCSDMTRTFCIGKPSQEAVNAYNLVLKAQNAALNLLKDGVFAKEADTIVREIFTANGCAEKFGHGLGHGVGLDIHELANLTKTSEDVLKTDMVITVEPGLYFENEFGIRIEDMVIVTKDGVENLTKADKELIIK